MRLTITVITAAAISIALLAGCGGDSDDSTITAGQTDAPENVITIKIGNITDLTGPGANGMELVNMALEDVARYCNESNYVPGVEFEVIHWDGQMDPSRTIPGYEWLQNRGADVYVTCVPGAATTLKSRFEADKNVLFTQVGEIEALEPPGRVFCLGAIPRYEAFTLLSWIAENDWDYEKNGPARIGAAAWAEPYASGFIEAMEDYAEAHPDQFDFVGGYLSDFKFDWSGEIELLRKCDYIFPPMLMHGFAQNIRDAGSEACFIGGAPHTAFFNMISDAGVWPEIDGMLIIYTGGWWHEEDELVNLQERLLGEYHPDKVEETESRGSSYGGVGSYMMMFDIIASTVEVTGPDGFNAEALYESAQSWYYPLDGRPQGYTYSHTKRYMVNELCVLEVSSEQETLMRNDRNWYPALTGP